MQNKLYIIVFLLLVGFTAQAQITDEPIDGGGGTTRYYYDGDNDNYGNPNSNWLSSPANGYVPNNTDCNDNDAGINPTTRWYRDVDGDGRGRTNPYVIQCVQPSGYVRYNDDIDDTNNLITHITPQTFYRDADGDGFGDPAVTTYRSVRPSGYVISNSDCNDNNASINPNLVWYRDADGDGWGNKNVTKIQCTKPSGYVSNDDDINDSASLITNITPLNFYKDADGDGYGSPAASDKIYASVQPAGYVTNNQDCWDSDAAINPNTVWYKDGDGDDFGTPGTTFTGCDQPLGYVYNNSDCNDSNAAINPDTVWYRDVDGDGRGATAPIKTQCVQPSGYVFYNDDLDDNNVLITNIPPRNFYRDIDGDGFGNPNDTKYQSGPPSGYIPVSGDCNDTNEDINPNTYWYEDSDGDGWGNQNVTQRQCTQPSGYVANDDDLDDSTEFITNITPRSFYKDGDGDGYGSPAVSDIGNFSFQPDGYVTNTDDCVDDNPEINPDTIWYLDGDGDDWGINTVSVQQCDQPLGYVIKSGDCDDDAEEINPDTIWYLDADNDGFAISTINQCTSPGIGYTRNVLLITDCDDDSPEINPDTTWYLDADGDGFAISTIKQCTLPGTGYTRSILPITDCNDTSSNINSNTIWYADIDGDGYGDPNGSTLQQCTQPVGYVLNNTDQCPNDASLQQGCQSTSDGLSLSNENYVFSRSFQQEMSSSDQIDASDDVIESVTYFDGLGRAKQQIAIQAAPNQHDIITHMEYDVLGRQVKSHLPFSRNTPAGSYKAVDIINDINTYYKSTYANDFEGVQANNADFNAYSESVFENSPLNRVVEQGAPGTAWKADQNSDTDHTIKFDWKSNSVDEVLRFDVTFKYNNTEIPELIKSENNYAVNELYVTITKDENWKPADGNNHTTREYKDKQGRVVLKRTYNEGIVHDTYYVYDRFGNLTFVIPPKVTVADGVSDTELAELCYQYRYDKRNRLIIKKIPGKGEEYIIYNALDQPVLTQDANQRKVNSGKLYDYWLFTKYDAHGRVAYTGRITNNANRNILQSRTQSTSYKQYESKSTTPFTVYGVDVHYTRAAYPTSMQNIYTINYYDTYDFDIVGLVNPGVVYGETISNRTRSLPTGTKVRVLDTNDWITTVTYYDSKGRPIYVASKNEYLNTIDIVETKLDFAGKVVETKTTHTKGNNASIVTIDTFTYDHVGRLLTQVQKINDQTKEQIVSNTYDPLGQLISKKVGGISTPLSASEGGLQTVDYTYNIRGWLTQINNPDNLGNDLFAFGINYNTTTENLNAEKLYNGNISETIWKTANDNTRRAYGYQYDALNRIKNGTSNDGNYNLSQVSYDKVGNILSLDRKGHINEGATSFGNMDLLSYTYDVGNKLLKVTDTANKTYGFKDGTNTNDDFEYDVNGNMILDRNKGITEITYNHLNLPTKVSIDNSQTSGNIEYIYDATGVKQKKITTEGSSLTTTEYAGNYIYKNSMLEFFNQPEGIVEKETDGYKYVYQFKDHLGNIRLSYKDANKDDSITQDEIVQEKNYYPFGLKHKGYNNVISGTQNNFKTFNGQELEESLGLNVYEMPLRFYDPAIGRWNRPDPITHFELSPYNGMDNNPIKGSDPTGADVIEIEGGYKFTGEDAQAAFLALTSGPGDKDKKKKKKKRNSTPDAPPTTGSKYALMGAGYAYAYSQNLYQREAARQGRDSLTEEEMDQIDIDQGGSAFDMLFTVGGGTKGLSWLYRTLFASSKFSKLKYAGKYGFDSYNKLKKLTAGKGVEVHHLLEQRFAKVLGLKPGQMKSIVLSPSEHQAFTNAWRKAIPYSNSSSAINTATATKAQIQQAAQQIYKSYPEILKQLK
ncbi:DUF6443 domain-containing protein [Aquimarina sp. 2201CG14-23]|uniref:DUF6443 domain-containing protein n=1 Tax=Aquimarina mycalae TaxID=3040073 RepID=UPI002477DFD1|nr:DUF6443 domain-containing protein [Aquimarina sp. 2201CG14-23]MDH7447548.1 DUF6443 domain-containing protein [Aquimarina sp. 2201CG14-23]